MSLSRNQVTRWVSNIDITGKTVLDVGAGDKTKHARNWAKGKPKRYVTLDIDEKCKPDIVTDINKRIYFTLFAQPRKTEEETWKSAYEIVASVGDENWAQFLGKDTYVRGKEYMAGGHGMRRYKQVEYNVKKFDIVFCLETLEHVWNPVNAVEILYGMLEENGVCYISVPFINPIHDKWDMLRFTDEWFEKVLPKIGFKEVTIKRRVATIGLEALREFYSTEGLRLSKIRSNKGEGHKIADIGYLITAKK